jgi:erythromycin esterase
MNYIYNFDENVILKNIPNNNEILLLGESNHGCKEFYEIRSNISKRLINNNDYNIILFESDWLNIFDINNYINSNNFNLFNKKYENAKDVLNNINKFPIWMWNNNIIADLIEDCKIMNKKVYFFGMDCYLFIESYHWIIEFLNLIDIHLSNKIKKDLFFIEYFDNTQDFIHSIIQGKFKEYDLFCENYLQKLLICIQNNYDLYIKVCDEQNIDIINLISLEQSCEVMINSYEYFKKQYLEPHGSNASWNTRDQHMLMTIMKLKDKIPNSKIIVWAHNSHIGDSTATSRGGQDFTKNDNWNLGQMCRAIYNNTYIIGFGNYDGNITAASGWCETDQKFILKLPLEDSIEYLIYNLIKKKNINNCIIDLKKITMDSSNPLGSLVPSPSPSPSNEPLVPIGSLAKDSLNPFGSFAPSPSINDIEYQAFTSLMKQRMIGVIYNSNNELESHYIPCIISKQFDLFIFISHINSLII